MKESFPVWQKIKVLIIKTLILLNVLLFVSSDLNAQVSTDYSVGIYDVGIVCSDSSYLYIPGHLISEEGVGNIDLDGTIMLYGDIVNDSDGELFGNIEVNANGNLYMSNLDALQSIRGTSPTSFENLIVSGFEKNLHMTDCNIKGVFTLNARFNLNENNLIINSRDPESIKYISGYIHSESPSPAYGTIQWNIGDALGSYYIPFGSGSDGSKDLDLLYKSIVPGDPLGFVKFATYPTFNYTNYPLPTGVTKLDPNIDVNTVDRFWIIQPNYVTKPDIQLGFKYSEKDVENPNKINAQSLRAVRFNDNGLEWNDWCPSSIANEVNNYVYTNTIPKQHFFTNWTLASEEVVGRDIWISNAFTPDHDESYTNETFGPVINFPYGGYEFFVYSRWGELLFYSDNVNNRWDGTYKQQVVQGGVYTWLLTITKESGKKYNYTGTVNVIL